LAQAFTLRAFGAWSALSGEASLTALQRGRAVAPLALYILFRLTSVFLANSFTSPKRPLDGEENDLKGWRSVGQEWLRSNREL